MSNNLVRKYIIKYVKWNTLGALIIASFGTLILLLINIIYGSDINELLSSFQPFFFAFIVLMISFAYIIRFISMIKRQESEFSTSFNEDHVRELERLLFLSDQWLICAGSSAYFKDNIAKLAHKEEKGSVKILITTKNGKKYSFWCSSYDSLDAIIEWQSK